MFEGRKAGWIRALLLLAAIFVTYANSLDGPFIFDDHVSILDAPNLRSLWPLSESFSAPPGSGASGRPLVAFSLALNYAFGELEVFGYHLFNVGLHGLTALCLMGLAQLTLARTSLRSSASGLATAIAFLWALHPINTDALNHLITRHEVLLAFFFLATLYCSERYFRSESSTRWRWASWLCCAAAMASKEIAVCLPVVVLAYDATLVGGSLREAILRRRALHGGHFACWILLALVVASGQRGSTVGFESDLSALDYLRTQAQGIPHYLRLCFWPTGLVVDYSGWEPVRTWGPALLPGLGVLVVFLASLVGLARKHVAGLLLFAFFAVLAPSSSFIPLSGEWLAEHRMYLPSALVIGLAVSFVYSLASKALGSRAARVGMVTTVVVGGLLSWTTALRNRDYASEQKIWEDAIAKHPKNARAHDSLAAIALNEGRLQDALGHGQEALRLDPKLHTVDTNLGTIYMQLGQPQQAVVHFRRAETVNPGQALLHGNFGVVLSQVGSTQEAIAQLRRSLELAPDYLTAHRNLAFLLVGEGRSFEALPHLKFVLANQADASMLEFTARVLATDPDARVRNGAEALRMLQSLLAGGQAQPGLVDLLACAQAEAGQFEGAIETAKQALAGAEQLDQTELAAAIRARIELFREGRPYHSNPKAP